MELKEHFPTGHKTLNSFSLQQHTHARMHTHAHTFPEAPLSTVLVFHWPESHAHMSASGTH